MPPPMINSTRLVSGGALARRGARLAGRGEGLEDVVPASSAAARKMVRTSSSTERPLFAARRRSSFFRRSSSWRTVREAIGKPM